MEPSEISGYRVIRRLGAGGMGEVFLVEHPRLPRQDAVKLLGPQFGGDPQFVARFRREADILAGLRHPNIVTLYDRGEFDGRLWLAMEYVAGEDAAQHLRTRGPFAAETVAQVVEQVGSALDWAWTERRLTHRDVKPGNILLEPPRSGRPPVVKLVDFGIAKASDDAGSLTATGVAVGTMAYLAPEVIEGQSIDHRADQYSLACTAFELLTGTPPFGPGTPSSVMMAHLGAPVPDPATRLSGLPIGLGAVFARAMAKKPQHRFADNAEFAHAFRAALATPASSGPADATAVRRTPPPGTMPTMIAGPGYGDSGPGMASARPAHSGPVGPPPGSGPRGSGKGNGRVIALTALVAVLAVALAVVGYIVFAQSRGTTEAATTATVTATAQASPASPADGRSTTDPATTSAAPTTTTSSPPAPSVPGTDGYGFVGSPARCAGGETLELAILTSGTGAGSKVVICSSGGSYTYRGARASRDNSGLTLPATRSGADTYRAVNSRDGASTVYTVSSGGLVITRGDGKPVASEPAESRWVR
ncbi:hypothetical protein GCM10027289_02520 [Tsukamurella serpentis]